MSKSTSYLAGLLYISFAMLPWVSFGTNSADSQLWSLLFGAAFVFVAAASSVDRKAYAALVVVPMVLFVGLITEGGFSAGYLRALALYASFAVNFFAAYLFFQRYGVPVKLVVLFNIIYILVGLLQAKFGSDIVSSVVNVRTSETRGVTSLAAEPTYFGIFLFFVSWWYLIVSEYKPSAGLIAMLVANFIAITMLAKSSMVMVFIVVACSVIVVYRVRVVQLAGLLLILLGTYLAVDYLLEGTRVHSLLTEIGVRGVTGVVSSDGSVNSRVADVVLPLHGFIDNAYLPGGFSSYGSVSDRLRVEYDNFFWVGGGSDTIMSFVGSAIYELGFLALIYMCLLAGLSFDYTRRRVWELGLLLVLLNSAISWGFTLVPFILATFRWTAQRNVKPDIQVGESKVAHDGA